MSKKTYSAAAVCLLVWAGCGPATDPAGARAPKPPECEAQLSPGPSPKIWVKTCDPDGRSLTTCWAGHKAVVATCAKCSVEGNLPRCEQPDVDLSTLLERELPEGLARCAGRLPYTVRLRVEGESKSWVIDTTKNPPTVTPEMLDTERKVDATLRVSRANLIGLITDSEWDGMRVSFAGRARIEGDDQAGMDAALWLSVPRNKEACGPGARK